MRVLLWSFSEVIINKNISTLMNDFSYKPKKANLSKSDFSLPSLEQQPLPSCYCQFAAAAVISYFLIGHVPYLTGRLQACQEPPLQVPSRCAARKENKVKNNKNDE